MANLSLQPPVTGIVERIIDGWILVLGKVGLHIVYSEFKKQYDEIVD